MKIKINYDVNKEFFFKYGYCVIKNFLNSEEIENYTTIIEKLHAKKNTKVVIGLHNYKECWNIIANKKILDSVKSLLGSEVRYLYGAATRKEDKNEFPYAWHRDNVCRLFGIGPDWNEKENYNVVRVGIYLSSRDIVKSGLNVIPFSHKRRYTFSNLLRLLHYKTKSSNNLFIKMIRKSLEKFIGINIKTNPGDCVLFLANVLHAGIPPMGTRHTIFLTYGTENIHAENYVNYSIKHRNLEVKSQNSEPTNNVEDLKQFLKFNNIYYPIPKEKKIIEGISIPKKV